MDKQDSKVENVRVFVRVRPFNFLEENSCLKHAVTVNSCDNITVSKPNQNNKKSYCFSRVFNDKSTQIDVYRIVAVPVLDKVFQGYNGTIFAYGQSGTGKTYTMIGDSMEESKKGIIPNIFSHIFSEISVANKDMAYLITVTYLEIYNEEVRDLLSENPNKKLTIRERPDVGVYVKDLLGFSVDSVESVNDLLTRGNKNRAVGSTKLNDLSSRSHAILTVTMESKDKITNTTKFGKLNLVDLAGSERVSKSHATGDRLKEAGKINLSLSVLGNVISALVDQNNSYIPYRNSKLTRLLQDSLGGNSLTAMIGMVSPSELDYDETVNTLLYAERVKQVKNYLTLNVEQNSVIKQFEIKICELQRQLDKLNQDKETNIKQNKNKLISKSKTKLHDDELLVIENEKQELLGKINTIQRKILIGGENLIEKAETQQYLLEDTSRELISLDTTQKEQEHTLNRKKTETNITKQQYSSLQEEDLELDKQIEEAEKQIAIETDNLLQKETTYQHEISRLLFDNKSLAKQLSFVKMLKDQFVPDEFVPKVFKNIIWDKDDNEWRLKYIAHSGNNLRKKKGSKSTSNINWEIQMEAFGKYEREIEKKKQPEKF